MNLDAEGVRGGPSTSRAAFWAALLTAVFAAVSLGVAVTTPPRSGPFASSQSPLAYPYAGAARFVPRDFLWMYPALLMMFAFLALAVCLHQRAAPEHRLPATLGLCLATISVGVIAVDYFIQLQTVQPALRNGEGAGLAALTQYNPHGVYVTLENLGFLVMSIALAFLAPALGRSRPERVTRWLYLVCAGLAVLAFVGMSAFYGFALEYRLEVALISLTWLTLVVSGGLLAVAFRRPARR